jgi:hypothetical protein
MYLEGLVGGLPGEIHAWWYWMAIWASSKAEYVRKTIRNGFFNIGIAESNLVGIGAGLAGVV